MTEAAQESPLDGSGFATEARLLAAAWGERQGLV